jgi:secreted Zn-dependent insulinase-like peptidase
MKSDGPLILAVLSLAAGLTMIVANGVGTAASNVAYPASAASLQMSISTTGRAVIGGLGLTALGLLLMIWALVCAIVGQFESFGMERGRAERLERREQQRINRERRLPEREERLRAFPKS